MHVKRIVGIFFMTRYLQVRLDEEEYEAVKQMKDRKGLESLQDAGREAVLQWLDEGSVESPLGGITKEEARLLRAVLRQLRKPEPTSAITRRIVKALSGG